MILPCLKQCQHSKRAVINKSRHMNQMSENVMPPPAPEQAKTPAHQSVYQRLRMRILFGDFVPGQAVTIQGLTTDLDVGMTPVREALRRLISDGALKMQGNRRVSVPHLTASCINQLDYMRQMLEPQLARLAARQMTQPVLTQLKQYDDALNVAIARGDIPGYLTQNYRFHAAINASADAPILAETVDRLWLRFGPSLRVVCGHHGTLNLPDKHIEMLRAFENRDPEAAARAMSEDVQQGMVQIKNALDQDRL